ERRDVRIPIELRSPDAAGREPTASRRYDFGFKSRGQHSLAGRVHGLENAPTAHQFQALEWDDGCRLRSEPDRPRGLRYDPRLKRLVVHKQPKERPIRGHCTPGTHVFDPFSIGPDLVRRRERSHPPEGQPVAVLSAASDEWQA